MKINYSSCSNAPGTGAEGSPRPTPQSGEAGGTRAGTAGGGGRRNGETKPEPAGGRRRERPARVGAEKNRGEARQRRTQHPPKNPTPSPSRGTRQEARRGSFRRANQKEQGAARMRRKAGGESRGRDADANGARAGRRKKRQRRSAAAPQGKQAKERANTRSGKATRHTQRRGRGEAKSRNRSPKR